MPICANFNQKLNEKSTEVHKNYPLCTLRLPFVHWFQSQCLIRSSLWEVTAHLCEIINLCCWFKEETTLLNSQQYANHSFCWISWSRPLWTGSAKIRLSDQKPSSANQNHPLSTTSVQVLCQSSVSFWHTIWITLYSTLCECSAPLPHISKQLYILCASVITYLCEVCSNKSVFGTGLNRIKSSYSDTNLFVPIKVADKIQTSEIHSQPSKLETATRE